MKHFVKKAISEVLTDKVLNKRIQRGQRKLLRNKGLSAECSHSALPYRLQLAERALTAGHCLIFKRRRILSMSIKKAAYPFMLIATGLLCMYKESLQNVIPGHPILSFLVLAFSAMVLTFFIMQFTLIGPAFSALCCMFILGVVFHAIMNAIKPDSVQYYILLTVVFSAISLPLCLNNLFSNSGMINIPWFSCIVAGILNTLTSVIYIMVIRITWEGYRFPQNDYVIKDKILYESFLGDFFGGPSGFASVPGMVIFYIVFAAVCLGAFVATIIFRDEIVELARMRENERE